MSSVPPAISSATRAGHRSRRKGARGENTVCGVMHAHGWPNAMRSFSSGAMGGGDIVYGPSGCHFEVKFVERLNVGAAFRQATSAARSTDVPVVVHKTSRGPLLATLPLEELLPLLALRERA